MLVSKYNRVILIDTENIHIECIDYISKLKETDLLIMMYSESSFKIPLEYIEAIQSWKCKVKIVKIKNGFPNAMDFCLVAEVAYRFALMPEAEFYIISNDHGSRPVISVWRKRGLNVKLFGSMECLLYPDISNYILQGDLLVKIINNHRKIESEKVIIGDTVDWIKDPQNDDIDSDFLDEDGNIILYASDEVEYNSWEEENYDDYEDTTEEEYEDNQVETEYYEDTPEDKEEITSEYNIDNEFSQDDSVLEEENTDKTEENNFNEEIKEIKNSVKQKMEDELKDVPLEDLEESMLSDREYNSKKIKDLVGEFSMTKESKLIRVIFNNKEFIDAKFQLIDILKKSSEKCLPLIESNWDAFRHNED